ncbi:MAG: hypothetical protein IGR93_09015 [Hydrococcus sp. C42_A2020_068]|nr:hypothetical protein [Hydrococcus sp. C42_A2020_068]
MGHQSPQAQQTVSSLTVPTTEASQQANTEIQPGQFVQYAFKDRAQVELLSVKRIQNPDDGKRNIVNVQMRVRNLRGNMTNIISPNQTIARNPETSERYESYDYVVDKAAREKARRDGTEIDRSGRIERSTTYISMGLIKKGASADGYVWLFIPEEVQTIDLIVPETAVLEKVPISG